MIRLLIKSLLIIILSVVIIFLSCAWYFSVPGYKGLQSSHFDGKRFRNEIVLNKGFFTFLRWLMFREPGIWPKHRANNSHPKPVERINGDTVRITFINHATTLIQAGGFNIVTDPIWSERCSPISFLGPKRVRKPGVDFENLPPIDFVLISHNHYDHLDLPTLKRLQARDNPKIFVGLGNKNFLEKHGISNVYEFDWWQTTISPGITITPVPAQHFSGRGLMDRNNTLWLGFVIETAQRKIYFAGDTGFGPHFKQIHEHFGAMDIALLPIGAFVPEYIMHHMHISPQEALTAAKVLDAKHSIGIHFGTFALADDAEDEPIRELERAKLEAPEIAFQVLDFGEFRDFN